MRPVEGGYFAKQHEVVLPNAHNFPPMKTRCVEVVRFIKEHSVALFMSRISMHEGGVEFDDGAKGDVAISPEEEAMMGRMAILVVCRFERLLVEEQVGRVVVNT